jgi:hypothetical protein
MAWKFVKMFDKTGNVDVASRVALSTAVAEDRMASDTDGLTASNTEIAHGDRAAATVIKRRRELKLFAAK